MALLLTGLLLASCENRYSSYPVHEAPEINKAYYEKALSAINESIEDYPNNADNYYKKALLLKQFGHYSNALEQAKKAVKMKVGQPEYRLLLAQLYSLNKKYKEAIVEALKIKGQKGDQSGKHALLAELYLKTNDPVKAFDYINKAIIENPGNRQIYYVKGLVYLAMEDTAQARENILKSINNGSNNSKAYQALTEIAIGKKDFEEALSYNAKNLNNEPDNKQYLLKKAIIQSKAGQLDSAKMILGEIKDRQANYFILNELGLLHYRLKNYDSAEFYAQSALLQKEDFTEALMLQARILDKRGRYWAALQKYNEIIEANPDYTKAVEELKKLKGKIAYLQKLDQQRKERTKVEPITPIEN